MPYRSKPTLYDAGDVVAVRFGGVLWHYGIVTSSATVITNSRRYGGVVEQSLAEFAKGRSVRLCDEVGGLDGAIAEQRARRAKGSDYRLTHSNCIDLTRRTHRGHPTPWQYATATAHAIGDMFRGNRKRY